MVLGSRLLRWTGGVFVVILLADAVGAWYLRREAQDRAALVGEETSWRRQATKPVVFGVPLNQNAAFSYRRSFEHVATTPERLTELQVLVAGGFKQYSPAKALGVSSECGEIEQPRLEQAFRCAHCDWDLSYALSGDSGFESPREAFVIANCLALSGHRSSYEGNWARAANEYLKVVVLGCDLGRGNVRMTALAVPIARIGLEALIHLAISTTDENVLQNVLDRSSQLSGDLPALTSGLRYERLELADGVLKEAAAFVEIHNRNIMRLVPWRAVAAVNVSRDMSLISRLKADQDSRNALVDVIRSGSHSSSAILRNGLSERWLAVMRAGDDLAVVLRVLVVAANARESYIQDGVYPPSVPTGLDTTLPRQVRYQQTRQGRGFRVTVDGSPSTVVLDVPEPSTFSLP